MADKLTLSNLNRDDQNLVKTVAHQIERIQASTNTLYDTIQNKLSIPRGSIYWDVDTESYITASSAVPVNETHGLDALVHAITRAFQPLNFGELNQDENGAYRIELPVHTTADGDHIMEAISLPDGYYQGITIKPVFAEGDKYDEVLNVCEKYEVTKLTDFINNTLSINAKAIGYDFIEQVDVTVPYATFNGKATITGKGLVTIQTTASGWIDAGNRAFTLPESKLYKYVGSSAPTDVTDNLSYVKTSGNDYGIQSYENVRHDALVNNLRLVSIPIEATSYTLRIEPGLTHAPRYIRIPSLYDVTPVQEGKAAIISKYVLEGYGGWIEGKWVSGSMPNRSEGPNKLASIAVEPRTDADGATQLWIKPQEGYYNGTTSYPVGNSIDVNTFEDIALERQTSQPSSTDVTLIGPYYKETITPGYYASETRYIKVKGSSLQPNVNYDLNLDPSEGDIESAVTFTGDDGWINVADVTLDVNITEETVSLEPSELVGPAVIVSNKASATSPGDRFFKTVTFDLDPLYTVLASI